MTPALTQPMRQQTRYPIRLPGFACFSPADRSYRIETVDLSSGEITFRALEPVPQIDGRKLIRLKIDWPVKLQDTIPLVLYAQCLLVRREGNEFVVRMNRYEFRTKAVKRFLYVERSEDGASLRQ